MPHNQEVNSLYNVICWLSRSGLAGWRELLIC